MSDLSLKNPTKARLCIKNTERRANEPTWEMLPALSEDELRIMRSVKIMENT